MCFDEGTLQAYLDGEVTKDEKQHMENHLAGCSRCQALLKELADNSAFVDLHLTTYKKHLDRLEPAAGYHGEVSKNENHQQKKGVLAMIARYKKLAGAVAVVALLGISLSFAPVRTVAAQLLTLFRVEKIETTGISIDDLNQIQQAFYNNGTKMNIENFGKITNERTGNSTQVSWEEAQKALSFKPLKPSYLPDKLKMQPFYGLDPTTNINFTLNVKNVNAIISELGGKHLLPDGLEGKTFTLSIPQALQFSASGGEGRDTKHLNLIQAPSPEIKLPEGVNVDEVRKAILDLPVIPPEVKQKLAALKDWQNTLYVPQPKNGTTEEITVNGGSGVLVKEKWSDDRYNHTLIWQKDGMLYIMHGNNISADEITKIANSLE